MEYLFERLNGFLLLYTFRASPQPAWLAVVNVPCLQIWPQVFQAGHPQNKHDTHLTPNRNANLKKKANSILRALWRSGECPSARRLCSSSFLTVKPSFLFLLTLPSFATPFQPSATSEITTMLMEAFVNNGAQIQHWFECSIRL